MSKIYVIHENADWSAPLFDALQKRHLPYEDWFLDTGHLDLAAAPPVGVFYSRMSASSHTRGHRFSGEYTAAVLDWLAHHARRVINPGNALRLELSKIAQYHALEALGIRTPRTCAAFGHAELFELAERFDGPFITKHNRGGKGLGVRLFHEAAELVDVVNDVGWEESVDGITLLQKYIAAPEPYITRAEFVGGRFLYAVRVDTSKGFELCPADVCAVEDEYCPTNDNGARFRIVEFSHPIIKRYEQFLRANQIDIAGIEFIADADGVLHTYDVNTNTNYNPEAESLAGYSGMQAIAHYLGEELAALTTPRRLARNR